jgi:hypothetical protein
MSHSLALTEWTREGFVDIMCAYQYHSAGWLATQKRNMHKQHPHPATYLLWQKYFCIKLRAKRKMKFCRMLGTHVSVFSWISGCHHCSHSLLWQWDWFKWMCKPSAILIRLMAHHRSLLSRERVTVSAFQLFFLNNTLFLVHIPPLALAWWWNKNVFYALYTHTYGFIVLTNAASLAQ